ncbi:MAG: hypothetical protein COB36_10925 [Alphaproteobacteria bacterium]|nr:MAG: hypothetical protein COB36_10925 [Alphaproteobacteria bacterium]
MKSIQEMINTILNSGLTEPELAKMANTTQPSINRMKRGETADPGYSVGKTIENIYMALEENSAA